MRVKPAIRIAAKSHESALAEQRARADHSQRHWDLTLRPTASRRAVHTPLACLYTMLPLQRAALRSARGVRTQIQRRHASHGAGDASSGTESFGVR